VKLAALVLAVAIGGCGGPSKTPELAPLDRETPEPPPEPPPATPLTDDFAALPSAPTGEPVAIAAFVPDIGMTRKRVLDSTYEIDLTEDGKLTRRQTTTTRMEMSEEITGVSDGAITRMMVTADVAKEHIVLGGTPHDQTLLWGTYELVPEGSSPHGGLGVRRKNLGEVLGREQEELSYLYSGEVGRKDSLAALLAHKPLRRGETAVLTDADKKVMFPPDGVSSDISMTLVSADGGVAVIEFNSTLVAPYAFSKDGAKETVGNKMRIAVEISTGRVLRFDHLELRKVDGSEPEVKRSLRSTTFRY
jgi:hypothetical protein